MATYEIRQNGKTGWVSASYGNKTVPAYDLYKDGAKVASDLVGAEEHITDHGEHYIILRLAGDRPISRKVKPTDVAMVTVALFLGVD